MIVAQLLSELRVIGVVLRAEVGSIILVSITSGLATSVSYLVCPGLGTLDCHEPGLYTIICLILFEALV